MIFLYLSTDQKSDLLTSSNAEYDSLCKKLQEVELCCNETEVSGCSHSAPDIQDFFPVYYC